MTEYNPKPDLWSKIQQRKDFDSQVKGHVTNLPGRMPKADLWAGIESELDRKTPVIPLWKYGMSAASIALILALSGIAYLEFGKKDMETPLITEVIPETPELNTTETKVPVETEPAVETSEQIEVEKPKTNATQQKLSNRVSPTAIEIPRLDLPDISIENSLISEVIIPPTSEQEAPETLHKVRISWGIQDKSKLRSTFGSGTPEDISERQIGRADQKPTSIKIRFKKQ
jgi:hypothetical protein